MPTKQTAKKQVTRRSKRPQITPAQIWDYYGLNIPVVRQRQTVEQHLSRFTVKDAIIFTLVGLIVLMSIAMI